MSHPEYRSRRVTLNESDGWGKPDAIERTCNEWAAEGFEVFSVVCPQPSNYHTFRLTAVRYPSNTTKPAVGRRFR